MPINFLVEKLLQIDFGLKQQIDFGLNNKNLTKVLVFFKKSSILIARDDTHLGH
jgi:hypothetical protein